MNSFLCELWPYLAGGLIGWLLAGWFARRLMYSEPPVERIVEKEVVKIVDNPEHLSLIRKLEGENSQLEKLRARINRNLEQKENLVDKSEHVALLAKFDEESKQVISLKSQISNFKSKNPGVIETEVEKIIEIDNPELLAQIKKLEGENEQISVLKSQVKDLEGKGSKGEIQVDNPEHLKRISSLEDELNRLKADPAIDLKAAKAAGITIKSENDLTAIEGIGPKTNDLIQADGITTFGLLSNTNPATLQKSLDKGGSGFKMANPGTWPDQANLAANNRWTALKALQDVLIGGVYPDGSSSSHSGESDTDDSDKSSPASVSELDTDAAKAAGFKLRQKNGQDNFTIIEGIGPKINDLIHAAGIHTFTELSNTLVEDIQKILDKAGANFKLAKPGTWPAQSEMAATNRWDTLKAWQDELDGGK